MVDFLLCCVIIKTVKRKQSNEGVRVMTVKQEYECMKSELRIWNSRTNWDDMKYAYHIKHIQQGHQQSRK